MEWWQIVLTSRGRKVLLPEEALYVGVRGIAEVCGCETLRFCIVDDHIHIVVQADRARAGRLAQMLALRLRLKIEAVFQPAWFGAVDDRSHLVSLVRYVLTQPSHHKVDTPDAVWPGSCFQDLIGARWIPGFSVGL